MSKAFNKRIWITTITLAIIIAGKAFYPTSAASRDITARGYEVHVHSGELSNAIAYFKKVDFWGEKERDQDLDVPRIIIAVQSDRWAEQSSKIEVRVKKELFYRALLPMILLSNEIIMEERAELEELHKLLGSGKDISAEQQARLNALAEEYGLTDVSDFKELISELLARVDFIPPSLALGQGAYESGYGTSRFAREGNAFFGMWTYSGDGMKPKEHRASKGDYGVASYLWPFDSVKSYMLNLNTHNAYQALRDKRAEIRAKGQLPTGTELAQTLIKYSEKGAEYVETLTGIIQVNNLAVADKAQLRDEPLALTVGVPDEARIPEVRARIKELQESGELDRIVEEMRLR